MPTADGLKDALDHLRAVVAGEVVMDEALVAGVVAFSTIGAAILCHLMFSIRSECSLGSLEVRERQRRLDRRENRADSAEPESRVVGTTSRSPTNYNNRFCWLPLSATRPGPDRVGLGVAGPLRTRRPFGWCCGAAGGQIQSPF